MQDDEPIASSSKSPPSPKPPKYVAQPSGILAFHQLYFQIEKEKNTVSVV
jgi:hypothetical protein